MYSNAGCASGRSAGSRDRSCGGRSPSRRCSGAEGAYAGVDPTGQTVVWWHQHSGSREEKLLALIAEFNESNEYGITVEAQNQGATMRFATR
jgi:sn-glycerol 3-phosphate transport system substrate-binding protein